VWTVSSRLTTYRDLVLEHGALAKTPALALIDHVRTLTECAPYLTRDAIIETLTAWDNESTLNT